MDIKIKLKNTRPFETTKEKQRTAIIIILNIICLSIGVIIDVVTILGIKL